MFQFQKFFHHYVLDQNYLFQMKKLEKILMNYLNFIKKNEISIIEIYPSVLKLFPKKKLKNLKTILIVGESL